MNSKSALRLVILGSALALVGAELPACSNGVTISIVPRAYDRGSELAAHRPTGDGSGGCQSMYPLPAEVSTHVAEAELYANCRMGYWAASVGYHLRSDGLDAGLCDGVVDEMIRRAVPWLTLTGEQHLLNTRTCERAFHGTL